MAVAGAPHGSPGTFVEAEVAAAMDPRLQRIVAHRNHGVLAEATASSGVDEIAVIAKVTNAAAWEALSEVRASARIGEPDPGDGTMIVTGRIPVVRVEAVRALGFVTSLKAARPLQPALAAGVTETGAAPDLLPSGTLSNGGKGVVVGIVDYGCDFAHRNFHHLDGRTRLLSIWHQGGIPRPSSPFGYGREHTPEAIDAALSQPDPYLALGYGPAPDTPRSQGSSRCCSARPGRRGWTSRPGTSATSSSLPRAGRCRTVPDGTAGSITAGSTPPC
jgi:hypothetical protein